MLGQDQDYLRNRKCLFDFPLALTGASPGVFECENVYILISKGTLKNYSSYRASIDRSRIIIIHLLIKSTKDVVRFIYIYIKTCKVNSHTNKCNAFIYGACNRSKITIIKMCDIRHFCCTCSFSKIWRKLMRPPV